MKNVLVFMALAFTMSSAAQAAVGKMGKDEIRSGQFLCEQDAGLKGNPGNADALNGKQEDGNSGISTSVN